MKYAYRPIAFALKHVKYGYRPIAFALKHVKYSYLCILVHFLMNPRGTRFHLKMRIKSVIHSSNVDAKSLRR